MVDRYPAKDSSVTVYLHCAGTDPIQTGFSRGRGSIVEEREKGQKITERIPL